MSLPPIDLSSSFCSQDHETKNTATVQPKLRENNSQPHCPYLQALAAELNFKMILRNMALTYSAILMRGRSFFMVPEPVPKAQELNLELIGPKADKREWLSPEVMLIGQEERRGSNNISPKILYRDYTLEKCLNIASGEKDGPFTLQTLEPYLRHSKQEAKLGLELDTIMRGDYFHGLPCGHFSMMTHKITLCSGFFELIEAKDGEPSQEISLTELHQRCDKSFTVRRILRSERKQFATLLPPTLKVRTDAVVARYDYLSRPVADFLQGFQIGPQLPAALVERQGDETWALACQRVHRKVLELVAEQCRALNSDQLAAAQALKQQEPPIASEATATPKTSTPQPVASEAAAMPKTNPPQPASTASNDKIPLLAQPQPAPLIAAAERLGFWRHLLSILPKTADGRYLSALLVSSPQYLEAIATNAPQPGPHFYFVKKGSNRIVKAPDQGYKVLPIWADAMPIPSLDLEHFNWQAKGSSELRDESLELIGSLSYGTPGLAQGDFTLFNQKKATAEEGKLLSGCFSKNASLVIYQDFNAKFPAGTFSFDLISGELNGPFTVIYDISRLFELGYHAVLLEECGEIVTAQGLKTRKRISTYQPGTYIFATGTYHQGAVKKQQTHQIERYVSPRYYDDYFYYPYYRYRY